jgi:hypothetical protein
MNRICFGIILFATLACSVFRAAAQIDSGRAAALDYLGRGTAAFRAGDMIAATRDWSEAIRWCRAAGAPDLEAQALARRGEAYRVAGISATQATIFRQRWSRPSGATTSH